MQSTAAKAHTAIEVLPAPEGEVAGVLRGWTSLWKPRNPHAGTNAGSLFSRVLRTRGITDDETSRRFLEPSLKHLHDPSLLHGLDRAAERLVQAATDSEAIVIYGDYDVDGISASAILYHTLKHVRGDCRVTTYVPHRIDEGYGLSVAGIDELCTRGARVIVSVDCGVTAVEPARIARARGVDLIITDHHELPAGRLPDAYAIVHPRLAESAYPFGELCGAGVAFKLAWRILTLAHGSDKLDDAGRALLLDLLGLCSLGVIADVVPLIDENRVIARFGLSRVRSNRIEGLRALVEASGLSNRKLGADGVGFQLAPRLNACGRMGHAKDAVELLTTASGPRCSEIASMLCRLNNDRRKTEREIFRLAKEMAEAQGMTGDDSRAIVLAHPSWHAGVVGIVCSRMVEKYARPTLLLQQTDEHYHGSGRSIANFDLLAARLACEAHLASFGGHAMAAGMKVAPHAWDGFVRAFVDVANARLAPSDLVATTHYDAIARAGEVSGEVVRAIEALAPFGRDNPSVSILLRDVQVIGRPRLLGSAGTHATMTLGDGASSRGTRTLAWNWGERLERFQPGSRVHAIIKPRFAQQFGQSATNVEFELLDACQAT